MKKFLLLAIIGFSLSACKKKADDTPVTIVAKWTKERTIVQQYVNGLASAPTTADNTDTNIFIQFNSDGSGLSSSKSGSTYTNTAFTYTYSGSALMLTTAGSSETDDVTTLTATQLIIHSDKTTVSNNVSTRIVTDTYYSNP